MVAAVAAADAAGAAVAHADLSQGIRCLGEGLGSLPGSLEKGSGVGLGVVTAALLGVGRCCCCCRCRCCGVGLTASVVGLVSSRLPRSSSTFRLRHGMCGCMAR